MILQRILNVLVNSCFIARNRFHRAILLGCLMLLMASGCRTVSSNSSEIVTSTWSAQGLTGRKFQTEHFDFHSTITDSSFESALPEFMEACWTEYARLLPSNNEQPARLPIFLLCNRPEWLAFTQRNFPARFDVYSRIRSGGFTEGETSVTFYTDRASTLGTLAHEGWHQYVNTHCHHSIPSWLNEGLACYLESIEWSEGKLTPKPTNNTFRVAGLRDALHNKSLMTLRELVASNAGEVVSMDDSRFTQTYYSQAWALTTFLRHGDGGRWRAGFDRLMNDVADGSLAVRVSAESLTGSADSSPHDALFNSYFGVTVDVMEPAYRKHITRLAGF